MRIIPKIKIGAFVLMLILFSVAIAGYVRTTETLQKGGQVTVGMLPCTGDWRVCQQIALEHLSKGIEKYPAAHQYTVRWCGRWIDPDGTDQFEIIYDRQSNDLSEINVGQADMDYCSHVTEISIHKVANTSGGFPALAKYGADYNPL